MTRLQFALYRAARDLLSADDLTMVEELARQADAGNRNARRRLHRIVLRVVFTEREAKGKAEAA